MWMFGRKHGKGTVTSPDKVNVYKCVYYHDMENLLDRSSSRCWDCAGLNFFLSLCAIGTLFPAIVIEPKIFIATAVIYLIIFCEMVWSLTYSFLSNIKVAKEVEDYLVRLGATPPEMKFWIQNYHYETVHYTDSKGRTHTRQKRVNTHFACEYFAWGDCVDKSPEPNSVDMIKLYKLTRVENGLSITYTPDAWESYTRQEEDFKKRNIRDTHWDYQQMNSLAGLEEEILLHNSDFVPWYANAKYYFIFSFCLMGWLYRILFILNSQKVSFDFAKIILK